MRGVDIKELADGVVFQVKVVPGSSKTAIAGQLDGMLKIKVAAPPEKGKANQCLIKFLAETLGVKKNAVSIISGRTNPVKQVHISSESIEGIRGKLAAGTDIE